MASHRFAQRTGAVDPASGRLNPVGPGDPPHVAFADALEQFESQLLVVRRRSEATVAAYRYDLRRFIGFVTGERELRWVDQVTPPDIYAWSGTMRDAAASTVRRRLCSVSSFYRTGIALGYATRNPVDGIERPIVRRKVMPAISDADMGRLLETTRSPEERGILLTFATTGVRRSELTGIRVCDVNLEARSIRVLGKGNKQRQVVIPPQLLGVLAGLIHGHGRRPDEYLFPSSTGQRFPNSTLQRRFRRWCDEAGLIDKGYTVHSLRRYAATRWLRHGLNVADIQLLLGHESLETTARYLSVEFGEVHERVSAMPPLTADALSEVGGGLDCVGVSSPAPTPYDDLHSSLTGGKP